MELHLTPESEAKLNELARRTHRGTDDLLQEAVERLVTYNDWFEHKTALWRRSGAKRLLTKGCANGSNNRKALGRISPEELEHVIDGLFELVA